MKNPRITIISTGSELTAGRSIDTNSAWIANQLFELGWKVRNFLVLPDDPEAILDELRQLQDYAKSHPEESVLAIMTGGLGATEDDYTLQCALALNGKESEVNEKARIKLQMFYESRGRAYSDILPVVLRQVYVPAGSKTLDNQVGLAVGFIEGLTDQSYLVCMPGVPMEMKEMFQRRVVPFLKKTYEKSHLFQQTRWIWNIGESLYQDEFIKKQTDLIQAGMEWGVTAQKGYIKGIFQASKEELVTEAASRMEAFYGINCTGDVFSQVHTTLLASKQTLAVAESCTGGMLGKKITDIPGSSAYFLGGVITYSNVEKVNLLSVSQKSLETYGAVSEQICLAMVSGLESLTGSDYSLSITGIAGPDGGSQEKPTGTVWIGRKKKGEAASAYHFVFPGNRETIRENASNTALFLLSQIL
jgi:nicotinamide-nucleotide amidase